jgi:integrase
MAWAEQSGDDSWRVRYRRDDGSIGSIPGFPTEKAAAAHAADLESDQRRGTWIDPTAGQITIATWIPDWIATLDIDVRTEENYRSQLRCHILPHWGATAFTEITNLKYHAWTKQLRASGLAAATVTSITKLFCLIIGDAVAEKLLPANPIQPRKRGRRRHSARRPEKIWAEPHHVLAIADRIASHYGIAGALLILVAAWTGARWGELTGLHRHNVVLNDDNTGWITIDPDTGALHESAGGQLWLGPPKTDASIRTITLPPFLVALLRRHLAQHPHQHVFLTADGHWHRRSNFARRALRPTADGTTHLPRPEVRLEPIRRGLTFHGLRHSHKTWLIDDGIPEIAQALRLGHVMADKVQETYSHVATTVEHRLLEALQIRWEKACADSTTPTDQTTWRHTA